MTIVRLKLVSTRRFIRSYYRAHFGLPILRTLGLIKGLFSQRIVAVWVHFPLLGTPLFKSKSYERKSYFPLDNWSSDRGTSTTWPRPIGQ